MGIRRNISDLVMVGGNVVSSSRMGRGGGGGRGEGGDDR